MIGNSYEDPSMSEACDLRAEIERLRALLAEADRDLAVLRERIYCECCGGAIVKRDGDRVICAAGCSYVPAETT